VQSVNLISDARFSDEAPTTLHALKTDQLLVDGLYLKPGQRLGWHKIAEGYRQLAEQAVPKQRMAETH